MVEQYRQGKVFQSDGVTAVNSGVPRYNDIAIVTQLVMIVELQIV